MQYTAIVRRQPTGKYRATAPVAPGCTGKGDTCKEALANLNTTLESWLRESEVTTIDVAVPLPADKAEQNPWLTTAGMFASDPTLESMLAEIYAARDAERPLDK